MLVAIPSARAHGPQVQIGIENGAIRTRSLIPNEPYNTGFTPIQRVYEIPMALRALDDPNDGWYTQPNAAYPFAGPGIATALGGFVTDSRVSLTFTDGLMLWNDSEFIDPGDEQIDAYRGVTHIAGAVTSDTGPYQSFSFPPITNSADEHQYAFFRLLGDGLTPDSPSDDGVYLLSLQLSTNQAGILSSDPYFYLLNKNATAQEAAAALDYVNTHILPEPSTLALLTMSVLLLRRSRYESGSQLGAGQKDRPRDSTRLCPSEAER